MKYYFSLAILVFSSLLMSSASVADALHINEWSAYTPDSKRFGCKAVHTKAEMEKILKESGWQEKFPRIDWKTQSAVLIAPKKYYKNKDLVFYGLFKEKNEFIFEYGWKDMPEPIYEYNKNTNEGSMTIGSSAPSEPSTIVVSFLKSIKGNKLFCSTM